MAIKPLHDRVIIRRMEEEEVTAGGIVLPDTAKEKPLKGEVVAVGPGKVADNGQTIPMNVKVGDTVLFGKFAGQDITVDGEELLVMREDDIVAIVE
ncbi:MAG TPA: co-chaperone GroES [Sulfurivirga caldicuralii]|nr:co-chaperone GroES [Sulfurivirga caldicuralii]